MNYSRMMVALVATGMLHTGIEAADVTGTLKDQQNHIIPNALIKVRNTDIQTKTDADGRFSLDLDAGNYTLDIAGGAGRVLFEQDITVSGASTMVNIQVPFNMDDVIIVRANPLASTKLDMASPTLVIAGESLMMNRASTLGDILENQPGMSMNSFGPAVARPVIRGLSGPRVLVTQNQMTVQDASLTSQDHDVGLEPLLSEQVEVIKGPATMIYGSGAIGGVVNVVDGMFNTQGADGLTGGVEVRYGDSATSEESVIGKLAGGNDEFTFHLSAFSTETDDIEIPGFAESAAFRAREEMEEDHDDHDDHDDHEEEEAFGVLENSKSEADGFAFGTTWIQDWGYINFGASQSDKLYGLPGHSHHHEEEEEDHDHDEEEHDHEEEEEVVFLDMEQTRIDLQAGINNPFEGIEEFFVGLTDTDYSHVELEGDEQGTLFDNQALELRSYIIHEPINGWRGIVGVQHLDREFSAIGDEAFVPPSETTSTAFFIVEEKRVDNIKYEAGYRVERQTISVDAFSDAKDTLMSFSFGAVYDIDDDSIFAVNLSRSERAPNVEELYSFGEHLATQTFEIGDPSLENESAFNIDLSYRFKMDRFSGEVNAYWNDFSDYIYGGFQGNQDTVINLFGQTVAIDDDFPVLAYQQQDAEFRGIEIHGEYQLSGDNAGYELSLGVLVDVIEAEFGDGDYLPRIPPWKTGVYLHYDTNDLTAELRYTSYASTDNVGSNELPTDGFDMLDFELGYNIMGPQHDFVVFLKAKNLLDEEARDHSSYIKDVAPRAGRSLVVGARYQF